MKLWTRVLSIGYVNTAGSLGGFCDPFTDSYRAATRKRACYTRGVNRLIGSNTATVRLH
jgi:hypothetical protein